MKIICTHERRRWSVRTVRSLMLSLFITPLFCPAVARAAAEFGCGVSEPLSGGSINFTLPTPIVFQQGSLPAVGSVLYSYIFPVQSFICQAARPNALGFQAALAATIKDHYFQDLQNTLAKAGLAMRFRIASSGSSGIWTPNDSSSQFYPVSKVYGKDGSHLSTGKQTFTMTVELYVKEQVTRALKISLPASSEGAIRLIWGVGKDSDIYPSIKYKSTSADLWYLPTCIGKVTIPPVVRFNRVYSGATTTDYDGTLPQGQSFTIKAQYNPGCGYPDTTTSYNDLQLKLAIKFTPEGPGRVEDKYIYLKNEEGNENGLRLRIRDMKLSKDAVFGSYSDIIGLNSTSEVSSNTFSAELEKAPGATIKTGNFTQRVKVDIDYY
ncbi:fimbrial protein [Salmonella enterica subsp. enterica serovar Java]|nr:fimbrial protein [Salmonella enterica]EGP2158322.1 fimbrial protein [Salmonella enterica subsp. enterica serovar Java]